jgi:hypothetical protein
METKRNLSESLVEAAACDAIGISTPAESAAYQQQLAAAGDDARLLDRELRETVARISAASPAMMPPDSLRGRILQATAPATFKMEDYRKATQEPNRFYRWGFYAAMLFLMAGGYYNYSLQNNYQNALSHTVAQATANDTALKQQIQIQNSALSAFVNPQSRPVSFVQNNKVIGRALVNEQTQTAVVFFAREAIPSGKTLQLQYPNKDGKMIPYNTVVITAPENTLAAPTGQNIETVLAPKSVTPDTSTPAPVQANINP